MIFSSTCPGTVFGCRGKVANPCKTPPRTDLFVSRQLDQNDYFVAILLVLGKVWRPLYVNSKNVEFQYTTTTSGAISPLLIQLNIYYIFNLAVESSPWLQWWKINHCISEVKFVPWLYVTLGCAWLTELHGYKHWYIYITFIQWLEASK